MEVAGRVNLGGTDKGADWRDEARAGACRGRGISDREKGSDKSSSSDHWPGAPGRRWRDARVFLILFFNPNSKYIAQNEKIAKVLHRRRAAGRKQSFGALYAEKLVSANCRPKGAFRLAGGRNIGSPGARQRPAVFALTAGRSLVFRPTAGRNDIFFCHFFHPLHYFVKNVRQIYSAQFSRPIKYRLHVCAPFCFPAYKIPSKCPANIFRPIFLPAIFFPPFCFRATSPAQLCCQNVNFSS